MKAFIKSISSLIVAIIALLGIFFLPTDLKSTIERQLDYIAGSENVAIDLGYQFAQKIIMGVVLLGLTVLISVALHRAYKKRGNEE